MPKNETAQSLLHSYGYEVVEKDGLSDELVFAKTGERCSMKRLYGRINEFAAIQISNGSSQTVGYLELKKDVLNGMILLKEPGGNLLVRGYFKEGVRNGLFLERGTDGQTRAIKFVNGIEETVILKTGSRSRFMIEISLCRDLLTVGEYDIYNQQWVNDCYHFKNNRIHLITHEPEGIVLKEFHDERMVERDGENVLYEGEYLNNLHYKYCRDGKGKAFLDGELVYEGEFKNNTFYGQGRFFVHSVLRYEGNFFNGYPKGKGSYYDENSRLVAKDRYVDSQSDARSLLQESGFAYLERASIHQPESLLVPKRYVEQIDEWWNTRSVRSEINRIVQRDFHFNITEPSRPSIASNASGPLPERLNKPRGDTEITSLPVEVRPRDSVVRRGSIRNSGFFYCSTLTESIGGVVERKEGVSSEGCEVSQKGGGGSSEKGGSGSSEKGSVSPKEGSSSPKKKDTPKKENTSKKRESTSNTEETPLLEVTAALRTDNDFTQILSSPYHIVTHIRVTQCFSHSLSTVQLHHLPNLRDLVVEANCLPELSSFSLTDMPELRSILFCKKSCNYSHPPRIVSFRCKLSALPRLQSLRIEDNCFSLFSDLVLTRRISPLRSWLDLDALAVFSVGSNCFTCCQSVTLEGGNATLV